LIIDLFMWLLIKLLNELKLIFGMYDREFVVVLNFNLAININLLAWIQELRKLLNLQFKQITTNWRVLSPTLTTKWEQLLKVAFPRTQQTLKDSQSVWYKLTRRSKTSWNLSSSKCYFSPRVPMAACPKKEQCQTALMKHQKESEKWSAAPRA